MISTKGRYALRFLADLAENGRGAYIPLKDISERQEVSLKYAERLMTILAKANLVESQHGKGGGYRLNRDPAEYRVGEVLRIVGEELAPVACLAHGANPCNRAGQCRTLPMWQRFDKLITDFFDGVTVQDLLTNP
ncbi:MAG: Rrf2 family transcriptional regulator [Synergistaceae bacterium]|nr:Rrf2 family transcriptional regulator [Synergistaceae bacterium]